MQRHATSCNIMQSCRVMQSQTMYARLSHTPAQSILLSCHDVSPAYNYACVMQYEWFWPSLQQADSWCIVIVLFWKIGMVGVVEYDPCVMHVQRTVQEGQQSSTRCVFIAVVFPYLLDQCRCCVEGLFGGHAY